MKLTQDRRRPDIFYLEGIKREDIWFRNLAGALRGSIYDNPNNPQHIIMLWVGKESPEESDMDIVNMLRENGFTNVKPQNEYDRIMRSESKSDYIKSEREKIMSDPEYAKIMQNTIRYCCDFRLYPNGKYPPRVIQVTDSEKIALKPASWSNADRLNVSNIDICFRAYRPKKSPGSLLPAVNEFWITGDEANNAAEESYFLSKYGSYGDTEEEEPLPFN